MRRVGDDSEEVVEICAVRQQGASRDEIRRELVDSKDGRWRDTSERLVKRMKYVCRVLDNWIYKQLTDVNVAK